MGKQTKITHKVEIFDADNVRIEYQQKIQTIYIDSYSRQFVDVAKATTDQVIPILGTSITLLVIFPSAPCTFKISRTAVIEQTGTINDFMILDTTAVTALSVTNPDVDNAITLEIFEAKETA